MNNPVSANKATGWINGFIGVLIFSGSLPATRIAVAELNPVFVTAARAVIAGIPALCILVIYRENVFRKNRYFLYTLLQRE
jgi:drug/metabolite transporter (DMT)-like permease